MTSFMKLIGACSVAFVGVGSPAFATTLGSFNYISNGDFETVDGTKGVETGNSDGDLLNSLSGKSGNKSWDVFATLPGGWTSNVGTGIEIQTNKTVDQIDSRPGFAGSLTSDHYVELDSEKPGGSNSDMEQTVQLDEGVYQFSFFYSPRTTNSAAEDNLIEYKISADADIAPNPLIGSISGPVVNTTNQVGLWTQVAVFFEVMANDIDVTFNLAAGGKENEHGGFIDNVAVHKDLSRTTLQPIPVPAPLLLIASAFGFAGAVRRYSRSS
ncbi:MAG: hypothetical protein AAF676_17740 [Pseudomonadota bacterium]